MGGLIIIDFSALDAPVELAQYALPGRCEAVHMNGQNAYVANREAGLRIVDLADPASPLEIGYYDTDGLSYDVTVSGNYAYVADVGGLRVIDISNPSAPFEAGYLDTDGGAQGVAVHGDYAYVGDGYSGLCVIDISNPSAPSLAGCWDTHGEAMGVSISGDYAYVAVESEGLCVIDVSDPANPQQVGLCDVRTNATRVAVSGNYAYVANGTRFQVIEISDPTNPWEVTSRLSFGDEVKEVAVEGDLVYVANSGRGLRVRDVSAPESPDIVGRYLTGDVIGGVAVSGDYMYVCEGDSGLRVVDISEPSCPTGVGRYVQGVGDVAVSSGYAYVSSGGDGLRVVDISDPANPYEVAYYDPEGFSCHDVALSGDHVYLPDWGLRVVNISDPLTPFEESYLPSGETPSGLAFVTTDVAVSGDHAYLAEYPAPQGNGGYLRVLNISDPGAPFEESLYQVNGIEVSGVATSGGHVYMTSWGFPGLYVINVSDPTAPFEEGYYDYSEYGYAFNVAVSGHFAYVVYDRGMQVVDVANPADPVLAGFYELPWHAWRVVVRGDHVYVAGDLNGLYIFEHSAATPAFLQSLQVFASRGEVRLVWEVSEDNGIGGYLIDRRSQEHGAWRRLTSSPVSAEGQGRYEFCDRNVRPGEALVYRLSVLTLNDEEHILGHKETTVDTPEQISLEQNFPNPFNPMTTIWYNLPEPSRVTLRIYDLSGRLVRTIKNGVMEDAGYRDVAWYGRDDYGRAVSSGAYFYRLTAGGYTETRRMTLVR
jgi:hypothetical protein